MSNHWLGVRLRARGPNRFAIGAVVTVDVGDGSVPQQRRVTADGSFESGDPTDLHLGLGSAGTVARVTIRWPNSAAPQVLTDVRADQMVTITQP